MSSLEFDSLKNSRDFNRVYKKAKRWHKDCFVLFYLESGQNLVGYTASKKVGNAVQRNFSKRRLRAIFREFSGTLKNGTYILVAKQKVIEEDFEKIKKNFVLSIKKLRAFKRFQPTK